MLRGWRPARDRRGAGTRSDRTPAQRGADRGAGGLSGPRSGTAILNGFGRSLGDGVIGLQALSVALRLGAVTPPVTLFRLAALSPVLSELYAAARDLAAVDWLPDGAQHRGVRVPAAAMFARCIDLRDFAFDADFAATPMIDFFLRRLGLDPDSVPPGARRNAWLAVRVQPTVPPLAPGYALVCPRASMPLRDMPETIHAAILERVRLAGWRVATQGNEAAKGAGNRAGSGPCTVPRDATLGALCGWVASAGLVVSTDTAMVHLADAFGVPCLAFFTTHRPEWRVRDYPLCHAVHLPVPGLPASLEFARDAADIAAAQAAWFPEGDDLGWLDAALGPMTAG